MSDLNELHLHGFVDHTIRMRRCVLGFVNLSLIVITEKECLIFLRSLYDAVAVTKL